MTFVFIAGPMKSGKTLELVARVEPFAFAKKHILYIQPACNTREEHITSRLGVSSKALVVRSLADVTQEFDVVGIDELHMFPPEDSEQILSWILKGKSVVVTGLDVDYRGRIPEIIQRVLALKPDIISKQAVCEQCHVFDARFSQILLDGTAVTDGLPHIVPEDGTYQYEARCRNCFVRT
ncbi:hypothetical protein A3C87_02375 [Candidatus Kaiserbacteria bacterium RIFCSPHIGHO2_02_FULL_49_34]|uniref:Thymidine kinase n=1 Tax=Candidatus Kaiserbacteria bacterium RIFCSPHIGHO2_02_FULL_49_34 TaxID=1798491 RepID=A0A1F6DLY6_9BACT|nr:MAG: hypothetical protein A3C87_02375 [Candidatus Kaiserbacteria bacterium RIFCSPHIGHO2_02_FULL_49_34]